MRTPHPVVAESLGGEFERETREAPDAWGRFVRAVDAYQAARSGRGEGQ